MLIDFFHGGTAKEHVIRRYVLDMRTIDARMLQRSDLVICDLI